MVHQGGVQVKGIMQDFYIAMKTRKTLITLKGFFSVSGIIFRAALSTS